MMVKTERTCRLLQSHRRLRDNSEGRIVDRMIRAGFTEARQVAYEGTLFGRIAFYEASAPTVG